MFLVGGQVWYFLFHPGLSIESNNKTLACALQVFAFLKKLFF